MLNNVIDKAPTLRPPDYMIYYALVSNVANWIIGFCILLGGLLLLYYLTWLIVERWFLKPMQDKAINQATNSIKKETRAMLHETSEPDD